jgi:multiple sugar transport system permease protein
MTANLLAAIPPLIFFLIFQRKIVEGIAMSGTKG